jgi:hypothetical protein
MILLREGIETIRHRLVESWCFETIRHRLVESWCLIYWPNYSLILDRLSLIDRLGKSKPLEIWLKIGLKLCLYEKL